MNLIKWKYIYFTIESQFDNCLLYPLKTLGSFVGKQSKESLKVESRGTLGN